MKKLSVLLFTLLSICSLNVSASGWTTAVKITNITVEHRDAENDIYLTLSSEATNTACPNKALVLLAADNNDKLSRLYSLAITAKLSGEDIAFYVSDDCDAGGYPKTSMMKM